MASLRAAVVAFLALSVSAPALAQLPDSPRGRAGNAFLKAFNSGDAKMLEAFVRERLILGDRQVADVVATLQADFAATGGFEMRGAEAHPNAVTLTARAKQGGERWTIKIHLEEQPPHRIVTLDMFAGEPASPGGVDVPKLPEGAGKQAIAAAVDAYLESLTHADQFSGVALVERKGEVIFEGAYGQASKRFGVDNRIDTKFNLGSVNKIFTQLCVARLISEGRLAWSDTIARWLPDYRGAGADTITVEHLTAMRSGIGDIFTEEFREPPRTASASPRTSFPSSSMSR